MSQLQAPPMARPPMPGAMPGQSPFMAGMAGAPPMPYPVGGGAPTPPGMPPGAGTPAGGQPSSPFAMAMQQQGQTPKSNYSMFNPGSGYVQNNFNPYAAQQQQQAAFGNRTGGPANSQTASYQPPQSSQPNKQNDITSSGGGVQPWQNQGPAPGSPEAQQQQQFMNSYKPGGSNFQNYQNQLSQMAPQQGMGPNGSFTQQQNQNSLQNGLWNPSQLAQYMYSKGAPSANINQATQAASAGGGQPQMYGVVNNIPGAQMINGMLNNTAGARAISGMGPGQQFAMPPTAMGQRPGS